MAAIAHASIPADDPARAAAVLAEMMGGEAMRFPPAGPDAWMAWSGDGEVELEIAPRGALIHYGEEQGDWRPTPGANRASEVHLAICVEKSAQEIMAIAERAGWPARACDRGGGVFQLTEVWVDGAFMIEMLDPGQTERYRAMVTPQNWKRLLATLEARMAAAV
jgi:hypothetical protein